MMPRTAIAQIAKMIGRERRRGNASPVRRTALRPPARGLRDAGLRRLRAPRSIDDGVARQKGGGSLALKVVDLKDGSGAEGAGRKGRTSGQLCTILKYYARSS